MPAVDIIMIKKYKSQINKIEIFDSYVQEIILCWDLNKF